MVAHPVKWIKCLAQSLANILKTMVVAIVIIISILVIPEGRQHWALRQGGYGPSLKCLRDQLPPKPPSGVEQLLLWYWALPLPIAPSRLLRTPLVHSTPTINLVAHLLSWPQL